MRVTLLLLVIAGGLAALIAISYNLTIRLTMDGEDYVFAAQSFQAGDGFMMRNSTAPFVHWPPLYPWMLAWFSDPLNGARILNVVSFVLTVVLAGVLTLQRTHSRVLLVLVSAAVLSAPPFHEIYQFALTENVYIPLTLVFLLIAPRLNDPRVLLLASAVATAATMTRYMGIALAFVGIIEILLQERPVWLKLVDSVAFASLPVFSLSLWLTRNFYSTGTVAGGRGVSPYTLDQNIAAVVSTIASWLPQIAIIVGGYLFWKLFARVRRGRTSDALPEARFISIGKRLRPVVLYILMTVLVIVITATASAIDLIGNRLLSVIVVPVLLVVAILVTLLTTSERQESVNVPQPLDTAVSS